MAQNFKVCEYSRVGSFPTKISRGSLYGDIHIYVTSLKIFFIKIFLHTQPYNGVVFTSFGATSYTCINTKRWAIYPPLLPKHT